MFVELEMQGRQRYFLVRWEHHRRKPCWSKREREFTRCIIDECDAQRNLIDGGKKLVTAVVRCSLKDQYDKEKGRMLSFRRAIDDLLYRNVSLRGMRGLRKQFWEAYKEQIGIRALKKKSEDEDKQGCKCKSAAESVLETCGQS